jgi:hypothetical protein
MLRSVLLSASCTLLLYVAIKCIVCHFAGSWHPIQIVLASGGADAVAVGILVTVVSAMFRAVEGSAERKRNEAAERQRQLEALGAENAAVVRVCQTVALAFAQPLSGVLAYSELLAAKTKHPSDPQRYEVEGVREGALQLACLLETLRTAASETAAAGGNQRVASDVAHAILQPRQRRLRQVGTHRTP